MSPRSLAIGLGALVLMLAASFLLRQHLGERRCAEFGLVYREGQGCVPDPDAVILQRDLQRS
jgi:hypothetical protein